MKKFFTLMVMLILACSLFAAALDPIASQVFVPLSIRTVGMGGAGLISTASSDGFFVNPAGLANRKFHISLPSVGVTIYNGTNLVNEGVFDDIKAYVGDNDNAHLIDAAMKFLNLGSRTGKNRLADIDLGVSFSVYGFGVGIHAQERLHLVNESSGATNVMMISETNAAATLGASWRFGKSGNKNFSVDIGVAARFAYKAYTERIGTTNILAMVENGFDEAALATNLFNDPTLPFFAGYAIPIDAGITVNIPLGFKASLVARNMNGTYKMATYDTMAVWAKDVLNVELVGGAGGNVTDAPFEIKTPMSFDFGFGWAPDFGSAFKPIISFDVVDIAGMFTDEFTFETFLAHTRIGAEISLLSTVDLRVGLNQGYLAFGAGVDFFIGRLDIAYTWQEFGSQLGDKPVDSLSIRFNLGYDKR